MRFFVGVDLHQAEHFDACMISMNRLRRRPRRNPFTVKDWIADSGAFTAITRDGGYSHPPSEHARHIRQWATNGNLVAAVAEDYMCEDVALQRTGLTVADHQRLTIERYDSLLGEDVGRVYVMPVLQGYKPADYCRHVDQYGPRLAFGAWVGVGSVCKRNANPGAIEDVLAAIYAQRPDLRLHGFGLKLTALRSALVRDLLFSADSMAWSYSARKQGRDGNDWQEARRFVAAVEGARDPQLSLFARHLGL